MDTIVEILTLKEEDHIQVKTRSHHYELFSREQKDDFAAYVAANGGTDAAKYIAGMGW